MKRQSVSRHKNMKAEKQNPNALKSNWQPLVAQANATQVHSSALWCQKDTIT